MATVPGNRLQPPIDPVNQLDPTTALMALSKLFYDGALPPRPEPEVVDKKGNPIVPFRQMIQDARDVTLFNKPRVEEPELPVEWEDMMHQQAGGEKRAL